MALATLILSVAFGASVGSFINLCADRLPAGKSIFWPGSHCDRCQTRLRPLDLVPVLSFFWLRGRCRYCGAVIPRSIVVVEAICGILFGIIWQLPTTPIVATIYAIHVSLFILVAAIDLEHQLIPNRITYPWALLSLGTAYLIPGVGILGAMAGGAAGLAIFGAIYVVASGGMGLGDVKLAAVTGLILGLPLVLEALALGAITGGTAGAGLLALRHKRRKDALPFGVFLAIGGVATLLWGARLWEMYLSSVGW